MPILPKTHLRFLLPVETWATPVVRCTVALLILAPLACQRGEGQGWLGGDMDPNPSVGDQSGDQSQSDPGADAETDPEQSDQESGDDDDDDDDDDEDDDDNDDDNDSTDPSTKFDVGEESGEDPDDPGVEFSFIWIANSRQGTVSKINTRTRKEEGRYYTGPEGHRDPSRTSVGIMGDVAVVGRDGAITKIFALPERCPDANGNGQIETSTGPDNVLAWGQDECVAWYTELNPHSRPAAWTSGEKIEGPDGEDLWINAKIWTSAPERTQPPLPPWADVFIYLLDADTGAIEDEVTSPQLATPQLGMYGGAVDSNNDFWAITMQVTPNATNLVHVPFDDLDALELFEIPAKRGYGMTVDSENRVWVGCLDGGVLQRFDPRDETWVTVEIPVESKPWGIRGMMEDADGQLWAAVADGGVLAHVALGGGLLQVDTDSATFVQYVDETRLPGVSLPTGARIDADGLVWMVDEFADDGGAFVYDPEKDEAEFVGGLDHPYTYSDMTGWALKNVVDPPKRAGAG